MARFVEDKGQMAVEFAVVLPILLVVCLIVFSAAHLLYLSNKFDHTCRQVVIVHGISPVHTEDDSEINRTVLRSIEEEFDAYDNVRFEVSSEYIDGWGQAHGTGDLHIIPYFKKYKCTMYYRPFFSHLAVSFIGANLLEVSTHVEVIVDPYRAGILV